MEQEEEILRRRDEQREVVSARTPEMDQKVQIRRNKQHTACYPV
jgi:hypothetical protein